MKVKTNYKDGVLVLPKDMRLNKGELDIEIPDNTICEPEYEKLDEYKNDLIEMIENTWENIEREVPLRDYKDIIGDVLANEYRKKEAHFTA